MAPEWHLNGIKMMSKAAFEYCHSIKMIKGICTIAKCVPSSLVSVSPPYSESKATIA